MLRVTWLTEASTPAGRGPGVARYGTGTARRMAPRTPWPRPAAPVVVPDFGALRALRALRRPASLPLFALRQSRSCRRIGMPPPGRAGAGRGKGLPRVYICNEAARRALLRATSAAGRAVAVAAAAAALFVVFVSCVHPVRPVQVQGERVPCWPAAGQMSVAIKPRASAAVSARPMARPMAMARPGWGGCWHLPSLCGLDWSKAVRAQGRAQLKAWAPNPAPPRAPTMKRGPAKSAANLRAAAADWRTLSVSPGTPARRRSKSAFLDQS